jgi:alkyl sulfatase BDS1-like metallo-beta-lactamase superfamily hydrolase
VEAGKRYVAFMGGAPAVLEKARQAYHQGDYRWLAEVTSHVVFADPDTAAARELEEQAFEQLGYQAENATWRNCYLMGARELREGVTTMALEAGSPDVMRALSMEKLLDGLAIQIDGPKAWDRQIIVNWMLSDSGERYVVTLENGVLTDIAGKQAGNADVTIILDRPALDAILTGQAKVEDQIKNGQIAVTGDAEKLYELFGCWPSQTQHSTS